MSNVGLIIAERAANIGNFMVGRLLPFREKRAVGPFVFIDHMGPVQLKKNENLDVPPHPHIGLSTLTYLFEGAVVHRDSMGTEVEVVPGAVGWMTAGKGVVHSERTPDRLRQSEKTMHGLQIWVAMPKELEQSEPSFAHLEADKVPTWEEEGIIFKLVAGEAFGRESLVPVHSRLYFLEIKSEEARSVDIGDDLYGESALYILEGAIKSDGHTYGPKQILIAKDATLCQFELEPNTTVYIFGGDPFPEERFIHWNFVSSDKTLIEKAKRDWLNQQFPKVPGETEFVPLPPDSAKTLNPNQMEIQQVNRETKGFFKATEESEEAGRMTYSWAGDDRIIIDHTEVNPDFKGKGVGKELVLAAVDFAREKKISIIPLCRFAKSVFDRNEDLRDVL